MPRVLITGVAGFMGSHVAEHCLRAGHEVVGVDDLSGGFLENVPAGVDFRQGSVTDADWVAGVWQDGRFDVVYHLAAYAAEGLSHFIRRFNYETNLVGSVNLINQAVRHDADCFVFTSSIAVYGPNQLPMTEDLMPTPTDPYGISKLAVELDLRAAHEMFGLPYVIFRPHNVYGERQNIADKYRNVIGIFINQLLQGQPMTIFGDGSQTRAFSYIDDVAGIIARAPSVPDASCEVFNVGAERSHSVLDLAHEVARALDAPPDIAFLPARHEVLHAFASHDRLKRVFAPDEPVALADGIRRMVTWAKQRGPTRPVEFDGIEIGKNLPSAWVRPS